MGIENYGGAEVVDDATRLWRYVDIAGLVALLGDRKLHFPLLRVFDDPWEGAPGIQDVLRHAHQGPERPDLVVDRVRRFQKRLRRQRSRVAVSCWYMAESESAAMWQLYAAQGRGIAIQSTIADLRASFSTDRDLFVGPVVYEDHSSADATDDDLTFVFRKKPAYRHENELRVVATLTDDEADDVSRSRRLGGHNWAIFVFEDRESAMVQMRDIGGEPTEGISVPVDIDRLVQRVVLAPSTEPWKARAVRAVLQRFDTALSAEFSDLSLSPLHRSVVGHVELNEEEEDDQQPDQDVPAPEST